MTILNLYGQGGIQEIFYTAISESAESGSGGQCDTDLVVVQLCPSSIIKFYLLYHLFQFSCCKVLFLLLDVLKQIWLLNQIWIKI